MLRFKDRQEAGRLLAGKLARFASDRTIVLGLPRGGVPVAYEVAKKLGAPLDTVVARKIGAPSNPEFGVGAIAPGDVIVFHKPSLHELGLSRKDLDDVIAREMQEMERRIVRYKSGFYGKENPADTVIIVDDGLATGVTARAAIESAKLLERPKKLIFAAPICAADTAGLVRNLVDELVCVREVTELGAIGHWYERFEQTTDEEVMQCLESANAAP